MYNSDDLSSMLPWLIDFGASRHMTGQRNFLVNLHHISPCYIGLSKSAYAIATFEVL